MPEGGLGFLSGLVEGVGEHVQREIGRNRESAEKAYAQKTDMLRAVVKSMEEDPDSPYDDRFLVDMFQDLTTLAKPVTKEKWSLKMAEKDLPALEALMKRRGNLYEESTGDVGGPLQQGDPPQTPEPPPPGEVNVGASPAGNAPLGAELPSDAGPLGPQGPPVSPATGATERLAEAGMELSGLDPIQPRSIYRSKEERAAGRLERATTARSFEEETLERQRGTTMDYITGAEDPELAARVAGVANPPGGGSLQDPFHGSVMAMIDAEGNPAPGIMHKKGYLIDARTGEPLIGATLTPKEGSSAVEMFTDADGVTTGVRKATGEPLWRVRGLGIPSGIGASPVGQRAQAREPNEEVVRAKGLRDFFTQELKDFNATGSPFATADPEADRAFLDSRAESKGYDSWDQLVDASVGVPTQTVSPPTEATEATGTTDEILRMLNSPWGPDLIEALGIDLDTFWDLASNNPAYWKDVQEIFKQVMSGQ